MNPGRGTWAWPGSLFSIPLCPEVMQRGSLKGPLKPSGEEFLNPVNQACRGAQSSLRLWCLLRAHSSRQDKVTPEF